MGSRITVYAIRKGDYKRNFKKMSDDKLEEALDNGKKIMYLDRKGMSTIVAKNLDISSGDGKKISISTGQKLKSAVMKGMHLTIKDLADQDSLLMGDVHALTAAGLVIEGFNLSVSNRLYGGYFVIYA